MFPRRLQPYRQGRLDGLCGVYALVNALRLLCPRLDEDACERAFCALIRARARQAASPLAVISGGLSRRELLKLIGPWQRFAAREFGVTLSVSRLKGAERHWTVAHAATERTLRVADSSGLRVIFRSQCTVGRTSLRYQLRPSEVLVVKRGKGQELRKQPCRL